MTEKGTSDTHLVIKLEDAQKYLSPHELGDLAYMIEKINNGRIHDGKPSNRYLICNEDEPYAGMVKHLIQEQERKRR